MRRRRLVRSLSPVKRKHRASTRQASLAGPAIQAAPSFYLTGRQPLRPGVLLLAAMVAITGLSTIMYALNRTGKVHRTRENPTASRAPSGPSSPDDDKDDPNQIDTIVLGDAADAPVPARAKTLPDGVPEMFIRRSLCVCHALGPSWA